MTECRYSWPIQRWPRDLGFPFSLGEPKSGFVRIGTEEIEWKVDVKSEPRVHYSFLELAQHTVTHRERERGGTELQVFYCNYYQLCIVLRQMRFPWLSKHWRGYLWTSRFAPRRQFHVPSVPGGSGISRVNIQKRKFPVFREFRLAKIYEKGSNRASKIRLIKWIPKK